VVASSIIGFTIERMTAGEEPRAARFLEQALLANILVHFIAMGSMALLLLPAMPGGGGAGDAARVGWIAHHPWLWRLGWVPWQLTAVADLWLGVALVVTPWVRKGPAIFTVLLTAGAMAADQGGQFLWVTRGVGLARQAMQSGELGRYLAFERWVFPLIGAWGCLGYLLAALGWTYCLATTVWNRALTGLSIVTWGVFGGSVALFFLPAGLKPPAIVASIGNAIGFVLLQVWLIAVTERVLRRSRYWPAWRSPRGGAIGRVENGLANSRLLRALGEWLPTPALVSDITEVVYVNYLVEADRLLPRVPAGLALQRLGPAGRYAMFSILTYRHGHFGPAAAGFLRRFFPSPIQSNWRLYVFDPQTQRPGVLFLSTAIDNTFYALVARWLVDGVPMHRVHRARITRQGEAIQQCLDPGAGSGPDLLVDLKRGDGEPELPSAWRECFENWPALLAYVVPQNRAWSVQPWHGQVTRQEIDLAIPLASCRPLEGRVRSRAAGAIVGEARPLCFGVPAVQFRFYDEVRRDAG
jgi:hypothetical protein